MVMKNRKIGFAGGVLAAALVIGTTMILATDRTSRSYSSADIAMQETKQEKLPAIDHSVEPVLSKETVWLENGTASAHDVKNGHMVMYHYGDKDQKWNIGESDLIDIRNGNRKFVQGETVQLEVRIEDVLKDGQTAVIGYINGDTCTELFCGKISHEKAIVFTAPETGEYDFYLIGASSDTIHIKSFAVI